MFRHGIFSRIQIEYFSRSIRVIRGQTWVEPIQEGSNRAGWSKYIKQTYVSTQNFVGDWNLKLFEIKSGQKSHQRSVLGQTCQKKESNRAVWSNSIQYTNVLTQNWIIPMFRLKSYFSKFCWAFD